jgi:hypothetical protein
MMLFMLLQGKILSCNQRPSPTANPRLSEDDEVGHAAGVRDMGEELLQHPEAARLVVNGGVGERHHESLRQSGGLVVGADRLGADVPIFFIGVGMTICIAFKSKGIEPHGAGATSHEALLQQN